MASWQAPVAPAASAAFAVPWPRGRPAGPRPATLASPAWRRPASARAGRGALAKGRWAPSWRQSAWWAGARHQEQPWAYGLERKQELGHDQDRAPLLRQQQLDVGRGQTRWARLKQRFAWGPEALATSPRRQLRLERRARRRERRAAPERDHDAVTFRPGSDIPQPQRYTTRDWLQNIRSWPHSPLLRRISAPVTFFTFWSFVVVCLSHLLAFPPLTLAMHSLVGTALGLLLVFRTNTANDRHWEGRKMWEKVVATTREIVALCSAFHEQIGSDRLRRIAYLLSAFPICLRDHVCGRHLAEYRIRRCRQISLWRLLPPRDLALVQASSSPPSRVIQLLLAETTRIPDSPDGFFSNRERCALSGMAAKLLATVAQCERLVQTPIPQSYVRHTSRFLSLWLLTLPFALCYLVGWWTPLVVWMASWSLCGIQELGQVIEHPFDGPQSLPMSVMSETVHSSMTDSLTTVASQDVSGLLRDVLLRRVPQDARFLQALTPEELGATDSLLGRTALHHAAYVGDDLTVERLLLAGADVNALDSWDGSTPLDVALARNHAEVAGMLQERGGRTAVLRTPECQPPSP